jgi:hypothetical protein
MDMKYLEVLREKQEGLELEMKFFREDGIKNVVTRKLLQLFGLVK